MSDRIIHNDFTSQPSQRKLVIVGTAEVSALTVRPDNPLSAYCAHIAVRNGREETYFSLTPEDARALSLAFDQLADEHIGQG